MKGTNRRLTRQAKRLMTYFCDRRIDLHHFHFTFGVVHLQITWKHVGSATDKECSQSGAALHPTRRYRGVSLFVTVVHQFTGLGWIERSMYEGVQPQHSQLGMLFILGADRDEETMTVVHIDQM